MPKPNARLTLRMSPTTSNREPGHYLSLVIEDVASGKRVVQFELLGEHLLDLFSGRTVGEVDGIPAYLAPEEDRTVLGKMRGTTTRRFLCGQYDDIDIHDWATQYGRIIGAHSIDVRRNNAAQHIVVFTHYIDANTWQELEREMRIRQGMMDTAGPPANGK